MKQVKRIGLIGCGSICDIYFAQCARMQALEIAACSDIELSKARAKAQQYAIARACSSEELMADENVDVVLNLTVPAAHMAVSMAALEAGKSVYSEKPLAVNREDGKRLVEVARAKGLRLGCAPDTFLGGGLQTCRKLIDDGWIGRPVSASAFMMCPGHESWHPAPEFHYKAGGGPMFDMGPYYLTALVNLLGPIRRVCASTMKARPERLITSEPLRGAVIKVEVPTHVAGVIEFTSGAVGTLVTSFDVWHHNMPSMEIYGTEGSLNVPDPNTFGGPVRIRTSTATQWHEVPLSHGYSENSRGIGLADMVAAESSGRSHRASGELAYHVLDVMQAFHEASDQGTTIELQSGVGRPAPLPLGLADGEMDT